MKRVAARERSAVRSFVNKQSNAGQQRGKITRTHEVECLLVLIWCVLYEYVRMVPVDTVRPKSFEKIGFFGQ
jgi:hypothetical protein